METNGRPNILIFILMASLPFGLMTCGGGGGGGNDGSNISGQEIPVILGQPGPGDIGNYFPLNTNNFWHYRSTNTELVPPNFSNATIIQGMEQISGHETWKIQESNADGYQQGETYSLVKDLNGIVTTMTDSLSDPFLSQLVPYWEYRFDLDVGDSFVQLDRTQVDFKEDFDFDGINEKVNIHSVVTFVSEEPINVSAGNFSLAKHIERELRLDITFSSDNSTVRSSANEQSWFVADLGLVKKISSFTIEGLTETVIEELDAYYVNGLSKNVTFPANSVVAGQILSGASRIYAFDTPPEQSLVTGLAGLVDDVDLEVYSANTCTQSSHLNRGGTNPEDCSFENPGNLTFLGLNSHGGTGYILFAAPYDIKLPPVDEGSWENPVPVEFGKPYNGQVAARGTSYFATIGLMPGIYTVFLSGLTDDADLHVYNDETYSLEQDCTLRATGDVLNEPEDCMVNSTSGIYFSVRSGELNRDGASFVVLVR
jgi:hypothetical protein